MKFYENYIGQRPVIQHLNDVCNAVAEQRNIPFQPVAFTGHAGLGKTYLAERTAIELAKASGGEFSFIEINSATSLPVFIGIWVEHIEGKKVIIFMDEAHAISKKLANFLKPILESNRTIKEVRYGDFVLTVDPMSQFWIFASNEEPKDTALFSGTGRCESIPFTPYSAEDVKAIIRQKAEKWKGKLKIEAAAVDYLVNRVLPNARAISQLVESDCLLNGGTITLAVAKDICARKGRFPMGLRSEDIKTLLFVGKDEKGRQVNEIAAACGGEDSRTTSYRLQWLAGYGFILTNAGKKYLTMQGKEYLTKLATAQKRAKTVNA